MIGSDAVKSDSTAVTLDPDEVKVGFCPRCGYWVTWWAKTFGYHAAICQDFVECSKT